MKRILALLLMYILFTVPSAFGEESENNLTYAVFPYLPDTGYYEELIENKWAELGMDTISLVRKEWNCYEDGTPEGIDVIMFDAVLMDQIVSGGWIQPIERDAVQDPEDIFPFAMEGAMLDGKLYGLPVFLCGNCLIYDLESSVLASVEHMTDLEDFPGILVVNSEKMPNREQYAIEMMADRLGEANPSLQGNEEDLLALLDRLAVHDHRQDDDTQVVQAYDEGIGQGYIGFSESMRLLKKRAGHTGIRFISFSSQPNIVRMYLDVAAVAAGVSGQKYEACLKLINIMGDQEVLTALSVQEGAPQYLFLARRSPYARLSGLFPLYSQMEEMAGQENNHVILTP